MIAFIKGTLVEAAENVAVIENNGIGFNVYITGRDAGQLVRGGMEVLLYTYMDVREDAIQLYGFLSKDDLEIFRMLLKVNGIGPKAAQGVLTAISANELRFAVLADDIKAISAAPGIGKKTAQKLILELKDKFSLQDTFEQKLAENTAAAAAAPNETQSEAVQALVALGYAGSDALKAVKAVHATEDMSTEDILRAALKHISF
ncbi:Holliday junction DNA helicase RuvA [Marvinbryantia formatexigens DSM 14469]|uniref:Holliday junction branch migration complex subunit RuvA n=1 Tax=Marvinbryantia formatexigens DSM 14469 TaxID=478749 RepID=C6LEQ4_9FIRM|nr:Holliday junction branch migration protein RuvA [Marvinbryantia formatexigens]EET61037.1 Holliday junction DNA helicase RuvA [Marvinbryantia formatexigens DSM 14469]UWO24681.1 Holliday junction branch migration protein RuvA [Marvinbryantia formatexigens DSM 14469]SDF18656.1 Holliday junction DNA helicase subunit RuvA [Marvinbryantia formatexigens]